MIPTKAYPSHNRCFAAGFDDLVTTRNVTLFGGSNMWICSFTQKVEDWAMNAELLFKLSKEYYQDVVKNEVVLANITSEDNILCIGGGICPFSAILFHQVTGVKVTVIDNCSCCVEKAQDVINRLGLNADIRVICQDGGSAAFSFKEYTVVHFALQINPLKAVFSHVESQVTPGTKLLIRRPRKYLSKLYNHLPSPLLQGCPITTHKNARNIGSTFLYIKQEYAYSRAAS